MLRFSLVCQAVGNYYRDSVARCDAIPGVRYLHGVLGVHDDDQLLGLPQFLEDNGQRRDARLAGAGGDQQVPARLFSCAHHCCDSF